MIELFYILIVTSLLPWFGNSLQVGKIKAGPLQISSMGCGTWSWGNKLLWNYDTSQDEELYESYSYIRRNGISIFDTADSYGTLDLNGRAELLLGEFERRLQTELEEERAGTPSFLRFLEEEIPKQQVATKFAPYPWRITRSSMVNAAKASLKRLQQPKLTLAQLHWSTSNYQPLQEKALWEGIADVYDSNLCEAVGVSNYGPKQLSKFASFAQQRNVPLATAQLQYSLMTYKDTKDVKDQCDDLGCTLIAYSPLCLGLLTGKYTLDNLPPPSNPRRQLFRELLPGAKNLLNTLEVIGKQKNKSMSQVAIQWTIAKQTVPIPGIRNLEMAKENLGAVGWKLDRDEVDMLDRAASMVDKPMIQNIFQTK